MQSSQRRNRLDRGVLFGMIAALSVSAAGCGIYRPIDASAAQLESGSEAVERTEDAFSAQGRKGPGEPEEIQASASAEALTETGAEQAETGSEPGSNAGSEAASQTAEEIVFETRDETVYVQTENVNVRTSPAVDNGTDGSGGNLAFVAARGQSFHRTGYSDGFSRIEKDGKNYYISSQYLSVNEPEPAVETVADDKEAAAGTGDDKVYADGAEIGLDSSWKYADYAEISSGKAVLYKASANRNGKVIAVNAGHGTEGGTSVKTWCHPDKTPKVTGGTTSAGATQAVAVSGGMTFTDGTPERKVTLRMAQILKEKLLAAGYDVLMLRDGEDVQLDNVARTVIANNVADCHISLHWDGDGLSTIKGCFYMSVPDALKSMEPVASHWQSHERLGDALIEGLRGQGLKIWGSNPLDMDLTQTSYSTIPSVDIELGNQCSQHDDGILSQEADGLLAGINSFFGL